MSIKAAMVRAWVHFGLALVDLNMLESSYADMFRLLQTGLGRDTTISLEVANTVSREFKYFLKTY